MNCSGTWWLRNPRPPFATAVPHHRCSLDPVLCYCGARGPPQPPAPYGATWWPNVAQNPFTRVPSHHYHQRPIKRGRSPERGFSCYYRAQGQPMCLAAPDDRRVWYNPERRLKRRPQPPLPARRWIELNDSSSSPSVSSDASQATNWGSQGWVCCILGRKKLCGASSRRVIVGNIHVLFNPKRGDIKLGQVRILLSKADALSEKWGGIPVVLAGDFNSTPQSAIYEFLSNSKLNITAHDRRDLSGQVESLQYGIPRFLNYCWTNEELKNATGKSNCTKLTHPLELRSSYATVKSNALTRGPCGEPLATTCHSKFIGTVDYLWYSTGLASTRVLDTLPVGTLKRLGGLPSKEIGSDHLALASEFFFTRCRELQVQDPTKITTTEE